MEGYNTRQKSAGGKKGTPLDPVDEECEVEGAVGGSSEDTMVSKNSTSSNLSAALADIIRHSFCRADSHVEGAAESMERHMDRRFNSMALSASGVLADDGEGSTADRGYTALPGRHTLRMEVPKYQDGTSTQQFFLAYEKSMLCHRVPKTEWAQYLHSYLQGRALHIYTTDITSDMLSDYDRCVSTIAAGLGETPELAATEWWSMTKKQGESASAYCTRLLFTNRLRSEAYKTRVEILQFDALSKFMNHLPSDCAAFIRGRSPKTAREAAHLVEDYEAKIRPYRSSPEQLRERQYQHQQQQHYQRNNRHQAQPGSSGRSSELPGQDVGVVAVEPKYGTGCSTEHKQHQQQHYQQRGNVSGGQQQQNGPSQGYRREVTCYKCGKDGHFKANGTVHRIASPSHPSTLYVSGTIAEQSARMVVDTGASTTVISARLIPKVVYIKDRVLLSGMGCVTPQYYPMARVRLSVGDVDKVYVWWL